MHKYWVGAVITFFVSTIAVIILLLFGESIPEINLGTLTIAKEILSSIVAIISIASFLVFFYFGWKAHVRGEQEAQERAEMKPDIKLLINNEILIPSSSLGIREVVFGFSMEKGNRVFCVIPFIIKNMGELTAIDIHVRVILPLNISAYGHTAIDTKKGFGDLEGSKFRRVSYMYENSWILEYTIPKLDPSTGVAIEELVDATYASSMKYEIDALTKDNKPVTLKTNVSLASQVHVTISARDTKPASNFFIVKSYETRDYNEISKKILREREEFLGKQLRLMDTGKAHEPAKIPDLLRKAIIVVPKLRKIGETKKQSHFTRLYIEQPKESKRWILDPPDGIITVDLKRIKSQGTSETH